MADYIQGAKAPDSDIYSMSEKEIAEKGKELRRWLRRGGVDTTEEAVRLQLANRSHGEWS